MNFTYDDIDKLSVITHYTNNPTFMDSSQYSKYRIMFTNLVAKCVDGNIPNSHLVWMWAFETGEIAPYDRGQLDEIVSSLSQRLQLYHMIHWDSGNELANVICLNGYDEKTTIFCGMHSHSVIAQIFALMYAIVMANIEGVEV